MQVDNFEDPITGKKFKIPHFITMMRDGELTYFLKDRKTILVNPENNNKLVAIITNTELTAPLVMPSTSDQIQRNSAYFKKRAKDHAKTDEQRALKTLRAKEELSKF